MGPCPGRAAGHGHSSAELLLFCQCVTTTCGAALCSGQGSGSTSWENKVPCTSFPAPDTGMPFTESQDGRKGPQWVTLSLLPAQAHGTGLCAHSSGIFPVREILHPVWAPFPSAQSLHRKILLRVQVEFPVHLFLLCHCWAPPSRTWSLL